jgi:outer membrane protein assembly factor BamB
MGLLKKILSCIVCLLLTGCGPTSIKLNTVIDDSAYSMFGKIPERNFYLPVSITDSLNERWEAETNGSFTNSSVAFSDSFVFINDLSGRITCFRNDNGKRVGQLKNSGTVFSTPVIHKFLVIYCDAYNSEDRSNLVVYDFSLGKTINETEFPGRVLTQLIKTEGGVVFVTEGGVVMKYNFLGHKLWENYTGVFVHSSPAAGKGKILFGNDAGEVIAVDEKTGQMLYRKPIGSPIYGNPTLSDGLAYLGDDSGMLYCLDLSNGDLIWTYQSGADIVANPVCNNSFVVAGNLKGDIFKLNKSTGELIWTLNLGGVINATPFLTSNRIIVPELSGKVYFLDSGSGEIRKTLTFDTRVRLAPTIIGKYLYVGIDKGILKSYEIFY